MSYCPDQTDKTKDEIPREGVKRQRADSSTSSPGRVHGMDPGILEPCLEMLVSDSNEEESHSTDMIPSATPDDLIASGADYDWDERNTEAQSCLDGMAALSIQEERPGYLGLASGASLLHLIQKCSAGPLSSAAMLQKTPTPKAQSPQALSVNLQREIPPQKIEAYIGDYFSEYHISYPLVHQGLFMAQYHEIVPRPKYGWTVLMYMVAALGAFMSATAPNDDDLVLYQCARSHLSLEILEVGSLTLVQSLSLISNYLQKRDRPNSSHNYLGLAVRMAYGLGLHKDHPNTEGNLLYREIRRRTWWCLFIYDVGSTITFSRPLAIPSAGIDAKLPLNISESDLTLSATDSPEVIDAPTIYTNVRVQSQFHLLTNHIYNRVISKPAPSAKQVLEWDDNYITRWLNMVPWYYKESARVPARHALAHSIMTWRYKHLRMIIYRPFLIQKALMTNRSQPSAVLPLAEGNHPRPVENSESRIYRDTACDRCLKESHETITSIERFWKIEVHTRMACWYALYFLFSATLVPVVLLRNEPQSLFAESWQQDIDTAIEIIKSMVELSPFAARCFETLESLRNGCNESDDLASGISIPDIPGLMDPVNHVPLAQMFSSNFMGWLEAPEAYFEEQLWYVHRLYLTSGVSC
ncbi:hypothetical protein N7448_003160 [Penicillium atrosanguineum]|nr:hypothetical protein N7526_008967 [Penicillium atrosanguineum]KAJ5139752.1 hypothetical protein N7448_003160 [Penicillium atrosanguineum]